MVSFVLPEELPSKSPNGSWVQTDRETHEAWSQLTRKNPSAAALLHYFAANVGQHNAVVMSQSFIAKRTGMSLSTVKRAVAVLKKGHWVEVRRIAASASAAAYVLNDRVVWHGTRNGLRHSLFSAMVIVDADEQEDKLSLGNQASLRQLPRMHPGEQQLPSGDGLPPPSEPDLPGMEPDIPEIKED